MLKRAMGVSLIRDTAVFLINCTDNFNSWAKEYTSGFSVDIKVINLSEIKSNITGNDIFITHTMVKTLYMATKWFPLKRLILIETIPPLFDRFPKDKIERKRRTIDIILTSYPAKQLILHKYRKLILSAWLYVAISDREAKTIKENYKLSPDFISYPPIDDRYFYYTDNKRNAIIAFGDLNDKKYIISKIVKHINPSKIDKVNEVIVINPSSVTDNETIKGIKITIVKNYTFEEMRDIYSRAIVSITSEFRGTWEFIPVESISSGVPVISPEVPSLEIISEIFKEKSSDNYVPYFNLQNINETNAINRCMKSFYGWLNIGDKERGNFSNITRNTFSIQNTGKIFVDTIEKHIEP